ncbi:MAG: electron transfer flavoprotein subunit beta/FixA family protein [bacterium]|nr:electron transfer flavoprotein subunit beta/FixA family protein [bacterium]MDD5354294.1 electron transfer flavoprotein subunit beta/FixA family protein [bacterium]MDD5756684.1 electron transfer flavoprotein subunit beta/FixA family protein [bacterium]
MNIIVCIKQVPGTTDVKISEKTNTLVREGVESIINPFDVYAIEEAIRIKEKIGGKVTILSMGPPQAKEAIKEAIAMGADDGILLSDRAFAGSDTWATSYTLSMGIKKISAYDLIICGKQAIDGDTAQVGPGIAESLGLPFVAYVRKIEEIKEGYIRCERMMEEGYEAIEMSLPALITVVKEINEPRLPSLKGMMRAKKAEITAWTAQDLNAEPANIGLTGSPTQVVKIFSPPARPGGEMILGEIGEQAEKLVTRLRELKIV